MSKFKVGDRVRCIDNSGLSWLDCNPIYTVTYVEPGWLSIKSTNRREWDEGRFELVTTPTETPEPEWMTVKDFEEVLSVIRMQEAEVNQRRREFESIQNAAELLIGAGYRILPPEETR